MAEIRTVVGRVGGDPEIKTSPTGKAIATFSVAENGWDAEAKEQTTQWFRITAWEKDADIAKENIRKGERVYVRGRYTTYEGENGTSHQITAQEMGAADRFYADVEF